MQPLVRLDFSVAAVSRATSSSGCLAVLLDLRCLNRRSRTQAWDVRRPDEETHYCSRTLFRNSLVRGCRGFEKITSGRPCSTILPASRNTTRSAISCANRM